MRYPDLTCYHVNRLSADEAVEVLSALLAERATISGGGKILRWSEFNENPDLLINELLARILVAKVAAHFWAKRLWADIVIFSIENSAAYLATALAYEIKDVAGLTRPVRLVRARKVGGGSDASPAMGEHTYETLVTPITADGKSRYLRTSVTDTSDFQEVKMVVVVDDFKATGSTLMGGVRIAQEMFGPDTFIIPMAALGKPQQAIEQFDLGQKISPAITALDVHFWADSKTQTVLVQVNGGETLTMQRAHSSDFDKIG